MIQLIQWDDCKNLLIPGNKEETIDFCASHFINLAKECIKSSGKFCVALSGGSTPRPIYELICTKYKNEIDWSKVFLFWGDERSVNPTDRESNYLMAMTSGFGNVGVKADHIFRMRAEFEEKQILDDHAKVYEELILSNVEKGSFDLIILGVGEDGHTASLFPNTSALSETKRLVVANYVPSKKTWRMTFTFGLINQARQIVFYLYGDSKKEKVQEIFTTKDLYPCQFIGSKKSKALWIMDQEASRLISP
jgi:6-phosphogluconolactonase